MKKILFLTILIFVLFLSGVLYSKLQIVNVYVCEETLFMAELTAKVTVSRKELYSVSYCECQGIHPSMKSEVKKMNCEPPKNNVYTCICAGKASY